MKAFLKNGGVLLILLGVLFVILNVLMNRPDNFFLIVSFLFVLFGVIGYIVSNRIISEE
ncbi:MAG: hypothetical protein KDD36_05825 [Flavobacteriales bacterium]|nr:hypothetical protein [Flavobacteriales bacterium]